MGHLWTVGGFHPTRGGGTGGKIGTRPEFTADETQLLAQLIPCTLVLFEVLPVALPDTAYRLEVQLSLVRQHVSLNVEMVTRHCAFVHIFCDT